MLVLYPGVAAKDIKELVALAKTKPGTLNYGSAGPASLAHLAGALFATLSDIQLTHVPYKSSAQSVVDLISGRLDMQFATIAPTLANIRAGQLRALAVTGRKRSEALPDVPTMDEAGVKGYEATLWFALMAPAGLPRADCGPAQPRNPRHPQLGRDEGRRWPSRALSQIPARPMRWRPRSAAIS